MLVVYRVGATYTPDKECNSTYNCLDSYYVRCSPHTEELLPPLLAHTSPSEVYFYPLTHARPLLLLLHTHTSAPFTSHPHVRGLNLTLYASPDRRVASLHLRVGWWGSLGRAAAWHWNCRAWLGSDIVIWMLFSALGEYERGGTTTIIIFSRCSADSYSKLRCLVCPNRSPYSRVGLYLTSALGSYYCRVAPSATEGLRPR
jgi:hypothetical protein